MKHFTILIFCCIALSVKVFGQNTQSLEVWGDFNYERNLDSKFSIGGDAGVRSDVTNGHPKKLYINPLASYRHNEIFSFKANIGLYQTWNKTTTNSTEYRFSQEVDAHWPQYPKFSFKNRFKLEEAFTSYTNPNENSASLPNSTATRFRYRLIGQTDYFNLTKDIVNFYALAFTEVFLPVSNSGTKNNPRQARIGVGFGQLIPKGQHYEVDVFWQGSYDKRVTDATNQKWIIRLRYYLKSQPQNKS